MNEINGIDEVKLQKAIETLKQVLGPAEAAKIEKLFESKSPSNIKLSEKEMKMVKTVIENPDMLKTILSSRQAREGLSKYLNKM